MSRPRFPRAHQRVDPLARGYHVALALVEPVAPPAPGQVEDDAPPAPASTADVYLFDTIGGWGISAEDFVRDVAALDVEQIVLHLNSPGGDALEGVAIANVLRAHKARVVVRVDGMAASAASVVAMAGDEVVMGLGAQLMIHDAWGWASGDAADLETYARRLSSTSDAIAATYAARAGGTAQEWRTVMRAEAWYTADEAVTAGLADRAADADETGTAAGEQITPGGHYSGWWSMWDSLRDPQRFDLSAFAHAGRSSAPAPAMPGRANPAASAAGRSTTERNGTMPTFLDDVRQRLGVAADADEATTLTALDEALDERAESGTQNAVAPAGTVLVDAAQWEATRAAAERGAQAATRQERDEREQLVAAAIGDGRIAPASREHWLAQLETGGEGAAATLAGLQKGLIPVGAAIGHGGDGDQAADAPEKRIQNGRDLYGRRTGKTA